LQILNSYDTAPPFFIGDNGIAPKYGRFYSHHHYIVTANTPGNQVKSWALRRTPGTVAGKTNSDLRESPAEKEIPPPTPTQLASKPCHLPYIVGFSLASLYLNKA
jgi:hypothetical protein